MNKIDTQIFVSRVSSICDEMGGRLRQTAFSPNIKDRLDFSCALFDSNGTLFAQAAHIPVHLGSMAYAMESVIHRIDWQVGDCIIFNDPYSGGTHLPDVTVVSPFFSQTKPLRLLGFVANRAHHANIGAVSPGSMPLSTSIEQEGIVVTPRHILRKGEPVEEVFNLIAGITSSELKKSPERTQRLGDINAQISANQVGIERLKQWTRNAESCYKFADYIKAINHYGAILMQKCIRNLPDGEYTGIDYLDDDGQGQEKIAIKAKVVVKQDKITIDFNGSSGPVKGNINCPKAVTYAAVYYVLRCLVPHYAPDCAGLMQPVKVIIADNSLLNAQYPSAVVAGNVETSMRIVDVLLAALASAIPEKIPASSQGTMNNIAMGSKNHWDYYETIGGGLGANSIQDGLSGVQSHLTNTLNTPIESVEMHYPLRILRYQRRQQSGGVGQYHGGDGLIREYQFLDITEVTLLTERRSYSPPGQNGGQAGKKGNNYLNNKQLPAKCQVVAKAGDILTIETPGGGGWGKVKK